MIAIDTAAAQADLARLQAQLDEAMQRGLARTAQFALQKASSSRAFKDHTGYLRGSIRHGVRSRYAHFVVAGGRHASYASFVEEGTRAHVIRARKASALRFVQNGQVRFAQSVKHPGTKPTHFMQDARDASEQAAPRLLEDEFNAVIQR